MSGFILQEQTSISLLFYCEPVTCPGVWGWGNADLSVLPCYVI